MQRIAPERSRAGQVGAWALSTECEIPPNRPTIEDVRTVTDRFLGCSQILPTVLPRLREWSRNVPGAGSYLHHLEARCLAAQQLVRLQLIQLERVAEAFDAHQIPFVLLKSTALRFFAYRFPEERCGQDLDIGVPGSYIERALPVLEQLGFERAQWVEPRQEFEPAQSPLWLERLQAAEPSTDTASEHFELGFLVRREWPCGLSPELESAIRLQMADRPCYWTASGHGLSCYVVLDLHYGVARDIPLAAMFETSWEFRAGHRSYRVPRPAWMLFHIVYKIYWEGVENYLHGEYQYADLCRLVNRLDESEVLRFAEIVAQYRFEAGAFYVLRRLEPEFGVTLGGPMNICLDAWSSPDLSLSPAAQNDLGDMWDKLWGVR